VGADAGNFGVRQVPHGLDRSRRPETECDGGVGVQALIQEGANAIHGSVGRRADLGGPGLQGDQLLVAYAQTKFQQQARGRLVLR